MKGKMSTTSKEISWPEGLWARELLHWGKGWDQCYFSAPAMTLPSYVTQFWLEREGPAPGGAGNLGW